MAALRTREILDQQDTLSTRKENLATPIFRVHRNACKSSQTRKHLLPKREASPCAYLEQQAKDYQLKH